MYFINNKYVNQMKVSDNASPAIPPLETILIADSKRVSNNI